MKNNLYIVTGGSSGLGKALALRLLEQNQFVICLSRSILNPAEIEMYARTFFQFKVDFSKPFKKKVEHFLKKSFTKINFKHIDQIFLINNAAVVEPIERVEKLQEIDVAQHIQINLSAPVIMTQIFMTALSRFKGNKMVVQITSGAAQSPVEGWALYCATKAGLNMFNQVLALQLKTQKNFKAIGYSPGIMDTNMQRNIRAAKKQQFPELDVFKRYKEDKALRTPTYVADDLLRILSEFDQLQSGHVYRVS